MKIKRIIIRIFDMIILLILMGMIFASVYAGTKFVRWFVDPSFRAAYDTHTR